MCDYQLQKAYEDKDKFIEGEWEEDYPEEHDWEEDLPFGYASDGVRVRACQSCGLSLVFGLDDRKSPLIESFGDKEEECNFRFEDDEDEDDDE